jgi:hypothetical protein
MGELPVNLILTDGTEHPSPASGSSSTAWWTPRRRPSERERNFQILPRTLRPGMFARAPRQLADR